MRSMRRVLRGLAVVNLVLTPILASLGYVLLRGAGEGLRQSGSADEFAGGALLRFVALGSWVGAASTAVAALASWRAGRSSASWRARDSMVLLGALAPPAVAALVSGMLATR